jgi:hypothetical protein
MSDEIETRVEVARKGKDALTHLEELAIKADPILTLGREQWRVYGAALSTARAIMPHSTKYGRWVQENGLDTGLARTPEVRSNAIWWAQLCADGLKDFKPHSNHPTGIRREYRAYRAYRAVGVKTAGAHPVFGKAARHKKRHSLTGLMTIRIFSRLLNVISTSTHPDTAAVLACMKRLGEQVGWTAGPDKDEAEDRHSIGQGRAFNSQAPQSQTPPSC